MSPRRSSQAQIFQAIILPRIIQVSSFPLSLIRSLEYLSDTLVLDDDCLEFVVVADTNGRQYGSVQTRDWIARISFSAACARVEVYGPDGENSLPNKVDRVCQPGGHAVTLP